MNDDRALRAHQDWSVMDPGPPERVAVLSILHVDLGALVELHHEGRA